MSISHYSNPFGKLDVLSGSYEPDDETKCSTNNVERKAKKMIKKIDILKNKNESDLNDDQKKAIKMEDYWRNIIDPNYKSPDEKLKIEQEYNRRLEEREKKLQQRKQQDVSSVS